MPLNRQGAYPLFVIATILSMIASILSIGIGTAAAQASSDWCASEMIPLIQEQGVDVNYAAPAIGCQQKANGQWYMPTVAVTADEDAYNDLNPYGQQLLAAVDRMSMDEMFVRSVRFDRTNSLALVPGVGGKIEEIDISDFGLGGPTSSETWTFIYQDSYEASFMLYFTSKGDKEADLFLYLQWFSLRRDATFSALAVNRSPMALKVFETYGYQHAPWPWQLASPYAIQEYLSSLTGS